MLGVRVLEEKHMTIKHAIFTDRLVPILQSIALKQQTGRLSIEHVREQQSEKGEIFFVHGDTIFAQTEHEVGETALFRMMNWWEVQCVFFEGIRAPTGGINPRGRVVQRSRHTKPLLPIELEETRKISAISIPAIPIELEEARQTPAIGVPVIPKGNYLPPPGRGQSIVPTRHSLHRPYLVGTMDYLRPFATPLPLPSPSPPVAERAKEMDQHGVFAIFRALPQATSQHVMYQMERRERVVFLLLNGKRTVRDVAHLVQRSEPDVVHIIAGLLKRGYIEYLGY
jgi:Domain of unknown function (DUF4388)